MNKIIQKEITNKIGMEKSKTIELINVDELPKPIKISPISRWIKSNIIEWIQKMYKLCRTIRNYTDPISLDIFTFYKKLYLKLYLFVENYSSTRY